MQGFSIIIPTLNRTEFLLSTLKDLIVQDYNKNFEILIIDQSLKEDTAVIAFCEKFDNVNYHFITHFKGLPEARNYGAKVAKFDYLLFLDDDISCGNNLLLEHSKSFSDEKVAICAGGITEKNKPNAECNTGDFSFITATPKRGYHKKEFKEVQHAGGGNFSVKKSVYFKVGGVDEQLTKGAALYEETDFCLRVRRAGYKIWFNYYAHVYHLAADTGGCRVPQIDKYIFSLARNRSLMIQRHLPWLYRITAKLYLLKLVMSYLRAYKSKSIWFAYLKGKKEGQSLNYLTIKNQQV